MRPSVVLNMKRSAVREAVNRFRTANPRVFGSALHGTDRDDSDLDLLSRCAAWRHVIGLRRSARRSGIAARRSC
jgi:predicted nucleotidyltransferase